MANNYADTGQAKLTLLAPDLATLKAIYTRAGNRKVAAALITDAGRTVLVGPAVTVLGIGPCNRTDYNNLTRGLKRFGAEDEESESID